MDNNHGISATSSWPKYSRRLINLKDYDFAIGPLSLIRHDQIIYPPYEKTIKLAKLRDADLIVWQQLADLDIT